MGAETRQTRRIKGILQAGGAEEVCLSFVSPSLHRAHLTYPLYISPENVREVLEMLGKDLTRKRFFRRLKRAAQVRAKWRLNSSESEGTIDETATEESDVDTDTHLSSRQ